MSKWYIDAGPDSDVVVSSRVRLARNFQKYPFPQRSTPEQQHQIIQQTCDALFEGNPKLQENLSLILFRDILPVERLVLAEKHLVSKELAESNLETAALISSDEQISIMINEEDHLRIQCLASGIQLEKAFDLCNYIDNTISEKVEYAFNDRIGYLTSCPTNVGTAIRVSLMLHLPALTMTGYIRTVLESCGKLGLAVRGLYGENTEAYGNMFQLSNQVTLGRSENDIILSIKTIGYQIMEQERLLRAELLNRNGDKLKDRIMRSYGVLCYARLLSNDEALKKLSDIRLGINLGLIGELTEMDLNEMMINIQPGSLQRFAGNVLKPDDMSSVRAEYVRNYIAEKAGKNKGKIEE